MAKTCRPIIFSTFQPVQPYLLGNCRLPTLNVSEAVYMQHLMGIDGVIVALVQEIIEAVSDMIMMKPCLNGLF
ncbi:hypothetical protein Q3G72_028762 [Acer saccharum]|nr:hypothetical protein Q3G72_028762 [Acer saccharum]